MDDFFDKIRYELRRTWIKESDNYSSLMDGFADELWNWSHLNRRKLDTAIEKFRTKFGDERIRAELVKWRLSCGRVI